MTTARCIFFISMDNYESSVDMKLKNDCKEYQIFSTLKIEDFKLLPGRTKDANKVIVLWIHIVLRFNVMMT